jgi:hypothetical protein
MVYPTGDGVEAPATRDQVVKVTNIFDVDVKSENFYLLLPDEMRLRYFEASGANVRLIRTFWSLLIASQRATIERWSGRANGR